MNTLPRAITAQVLSDPNTYQHLRSHWSELMRTSRKHELFGAHHLLYLALLGKDWRKSFTCITNRRKLDNGAFYGWGLFRAMAVLHMPSCEANLLAPFDGLVTPAMVEHIRQLVPFQNKYSYRPEQFAAASFAFEAYTVTGSAQASITDDRNTHA
jgi:hypothetical protein